MKKFKAKRIPTLLVVVPLWILTMLVILGIYIIISVSGASIKKTLTTGLSISDGQELGKIVKAKKKANDGVRLSGSSVKAKNLTYSYAELDGINVGLYASNYYLPYKENDTANNGNITFYVGFNKINKNNNIDLKITNCNVIVAEKWHNYASSKSSITSSSYYSNTILNYSTMAFYDSTKSITISKDQKFPKRYLLGMVNVKNPNVYVQLQYTLGKESKSYIVEFNYDSFFISGQTTNTK